jgi:4-hydroxyphenylpyruvate dioxygenase-like putative hemolysin
MALLLEAGKAKDYPSAYAMALRLHDDLFAAEQAQKAQAAEAARREQASKAVAAAKGNAVSVKSATPASAGAKQPSTRREALESAWDQHATGRL